MSTTASPAAPKYMTLGAAAAALGIPAWKLCRAYKLGRLPEPARVGILRAISPDDLERARRHFAGQAGA